MIQRSYLCYAIAYPPGNAFYRLRHCQLTVERVRTPPSSPLLSPAPAALEDTPELGKGLEESEPGAFEAHVAPVLATPPEEPAKVVEEATQADSSLGPSPADEVDQFEVTHDAPEAEEIHPIDEAPSAEETVTGFVAPEVHEEDSPVEATAEKPAEESPESPLAVASKEDERVVLEVIEPTAAEEVIPSAQADEASKDTTEDEQDSEEKAAEASAQSPVSSAFEDETSDREEEPEASEQSLPGASCDEADGSQEPSELSVPEALSQEARADESPAGQAEADLIKEDLPLASEANVEAAAVDEGEADVPLFAETPSPDDVDHTATEQLDLGVDSPPQLDTGFGDAVPLEEHSSKPSDQPPSPPSDRVFTKRSRSHSRSRDRSRPAARKDKMASKATTDSSVGVAAAAPAADGPVKRTAMPDEKAQQQLLNDIKDKIDAHKKQQDDLANSIRALGNINDVFRAKVDKLTARQNELRATVTSLTGESGEARRAREAAQRDAEAARKNIPYKTVQEIDTAISDLEKRMNSGSLRLVEEKKCVQDISALKKARSTLETVEKKASGKEGGAAASGKQGDLDRAQAELEDVRKQIEAAKEARNADFEKLNQLRSQQRVIDGQIKQLLDERSRAITAYQKQQEEYRKFAAVEAKRRAEEERAWREQLRLERKKAMEERRKEERTLPKYVDKIDACTNLINYLKETYLKNGAESDSATNDTAKKAPPAELEGSVLLTRDRDEEYFGSVVSKKDKSKKGKKQAPKVQETVKLSLGVVEALIKHDVAVPTDITEVAKAVDILTERRDNYEKLQKEEIQKGEEEERAERERERLAEQQGHNQKGSAAAETAAQPAAEAEQEEKEEGEL